MEIEKISLIIFLHQLRRSIFDVLSRSALITFVLMSFRRYLPFDVLSFCFFLLFGVFSVDILSHSTFCPSTFFWPSAFFTSTFCQWIFFFFSGRLCTVYVLNRIEHFISRQQAAQNNKEHSIMVYIYTQILRAVEPEAG